MKNKNNTNNTKSFTLPTMAVIMLSCGFAALSLFFSQTAIGANGYGYNGYGYSCEDQYGYGYKCDNYEDDKDDHKGGLFWKKYKHYKQRYDKKESRQAYFKVRYLKESKNPALNAMFWEMRNIYVTHKFDSQAVFSRLNPIVQEKFKLYKEYHGHKKYREYKDEVY